MTPQLKYILESVTKIFAFIASSLLLILNLSVLYGWYVKNIDLVQPFPPHIPMTANAALSFIFLSIVVLLAFFKRLNFVSVFLALFVFVIAAASLFEHVTSSDLKIDELLIQQNFISDSLNKHGRMASNTAINLGLASLALLLLVINSKKHSIIIGEFLGLIVFGMGAIFTSGYVLEIENLYWWGNVIPMAPTSAISFMLMGCAIAGLALYRALQEEVNLADVIPVLIFMVFVINSILYWQALGDYQSDNHLGASNTPTIALIGGIIMGALAALLLHYYIRNMRSVYIVNVEVKKSREALALVQATLESTADGILVVNKNGEIVGYNQKFLQMWGIPEQLIKSTTLNFKKIDNQFSTVKDAELLRSEVSKNIADLAMEASDKLYLRDGKVLERYAIPQRADGKVIGMVLSYRDVTEYESMLKQIVHQKTHDSVTGLPNRLLLRDRIDLYISAAKNSNQLVAIIFLSINRFKYISDNSGNKVSEALLRGVTERLTPLIESNNTFACLDRDKFVIVLNSLKYAEDCVPFVRQCLSELSQPFQINGGEKALTFRIGISLYPKDGGSADELMSNSETALNGNRSETESSFQFYTKEIHSLIVDRLQLENDLTIALKKNEFQLYYQPIINLQTRVITGVETLLRWHHPKLGIVAPQDFITLAEKSGLIVPIGNWILNQACSQLNKWKKKGILPIRMAINVSSMQFHQATLAATISKALKDYGLDPQDIEIEITESSLMEHSDDSINQLMSLFNLGVRLSIDDFGTGYSSLSYLTRFPVHTLKIDQSFIRHLDTNINDVAIVKSIINMGKNLRLNVLAEGIENERQLDILRQFKCDEGQGYYFSKPLVEADLLKLIRK